MKYTGRIFASLGMFLLHTTYIVYYYLRDAKIESLDLYSTPFLILVGIWAGLQYDKARFLSEKDMLTSLYNRRFIIKTFEKIASICDRTNSKLFVLIIDCNNFKIINDTFGHQKGDLVLTAIAETLTNSTRKSDIVARWGGDEFLVIGHYKNELGLQAFINRLNNDLGNLSKQINIDVGVSIGSAIFPDDSLDLDELIKTADRNMYKSKEQRKAL